MEKVRINEPSSFLITGIGRSGSKYLAQMLNAATNFYVTHEVVGDELEAVNKIGATTSAIEKGRLLDYLNTQDHRFLLNGRFIGFLFRSYGEANSYLRFVSVSLKRQLGLRVLYILRSPTEVALSASHRWMLMEEKDKKDKKDKIREEYLTNAATAILAYVQFVLCLLTSEWISPQDLLLFDCFTKNAGEIHRLIGLLGLTCTDGKYVEKNVGDKVNASMTKAASLIEAYDRRSIEKIEQAEKLYIGLETAARWTGSGFST